MTCNILIDGEIINELSEIMNAEKDKNHAPKPQRKEKKNGNK